MRGERFVPYIINLVRLIKDLSVKVKKNSDDSEEISDHDKGMAMGYYFIITLLKQQAFAVCIDQKELGLADMKPDEDLLGLHRNPDVDFGEDNWSIDVMTEEKIHGYLVDSIELLKEQAREAMREASHSTEDERDYNNGSLTAYRLVFSLLKKQASIFNIAQEDLGLADIEPERDFSL